MHIHVHGEMMLFGGLLTDSRLTDDKGGLFLTVTPMGDKPKNFFVALLDRDKVTPTELGRIAKGLRVNSEIVVACRFGEYEGKRKTRVQRFFTASEAAQLDEIYGERPDGEPEAAAAAAGAVKK